MNFALSIQGSPYDSACHWSALRFAEAVLEAGHSIHRIFFYHDAVLIGSNLQAPPQDEVDLTRSWQALSSQHHLDLCLCIASCLRRGIINQTEATRLEKPDENLHIGFTITGLGQLIEAALVTDRLVTFRG